MSHQSTPLNNGFALLEVLIAIAFFSMVVLSIYSSVSNGAIAISKSANSLKACSIARSKLNEFRIEKSKLDIPMKKVSEDERFSYSRKIERFEHPMLTAVQASKVTIIVEWLENGNPRNYELSYVFPD